jgi:hypothetical protein
MKNIKLTYAILSIMIIFANLNYCNGQATALGNFSTSVEYLGFTNAGHDLNFGFGTPLPIPYMSLSNTFNPGYLAIGNTFSSPLSLLHLDATNNAQGDGEVFRSNCYSGYDTYWRMFRGGTEYGNFVNYSYDAPGRREAEALKCVVGLRDFSNL